MSNGEDEAFGDDNEGRFDCDLTYQPIVIEKQALNLNQLLQHAVPADEKEKQKQNALFVQLLDSAASNINDFPNMVSEPEAPDGFDKLNKNAHIGKGISGAIDVTAQFAKSCAKERSGTVQEIRRSGTKHMLDEPMMTKT